ncbi:hypothetical protein G6F22_005145 [Rhizopus arrhizus]|uniref:RNA-directed DNA polymerase n=1 Tax=Rhizopus oryzae TaxID=64495 RepID=A0A9P6X0E5_RHIOR|nr:hypothetical protein G6F23_007725 [Rhizopus arrhizus]KAG0782807.1 hypothetical protein G6F21_010906 [Rhizopus arrhizus]KAG0795318.1 hypothetical protein G6F22_005145 [Rhizopus arrhizus]KAG0934035.1 hypothetical protein G6F32_010859 [Rhizopus arrhizus]KAG0960674.1 hypothetical protein G6F31_010418 [Rhizopus arrhizus]
MSGVIEEDIIMGSPGASVSGKGVYLDKDMLNDLLRTLTAKSAPSFRVREPDLYRGERSSLIVTSWISSLETYFELVPMQEKERILYAVTLLRGDALIWWNQYKTSRITPEDWPTFKNVLENEFKPVNATQAARDKMAALTQRTNVASYINEFRSLQLQIKDMSSGDALDRFVRGLKSQLRVMVRSRFPHSLESAESIALAIEAAMNDGEYATSYATNAPVANNPCTRSQSTIHALPNDDPMDLDSIQHAINVLSKAYRFNRKENNLGNHNTSRQQVRCYGCQGMGHMKNECPTWRKSGRRFRQGFQSNNGRKQQSLNNMETINQDNKSVAKFNEDEYNDDDDKQLLAQDGAHILNFNNKVTDLPLYEMTLYNGKNGSGKIKALLDTGAGSNYIAPRLITNFMKIIPLRTASEVETAGGHKMTIDKKVEFILRIGKLCYRIQAYIFDMKFDLILGQQWLKQAKPTPDWKTNSWVLSNCKGLKETIVPCANPTVAMPFAPVRDFAYVMSKRQLQRSTKKNQVEELYLVHFNDNKAVEKVNSTLLKEFKDVFCEGSLPGLPPMRTVEHVIDTGEAKPVNRPPFKMSPRELDELQRQLKELLSAGFIRPSYSPWGAPVLFVRKKDGSLRMCIDYRAINSLTKRISTPLPRIDECLERLGGAKYFSSIDLKSGYHQVRIRKEDIPKTAFNTRYGSYEFLVLPFGLTNSPPTFQKMMNDVLRDYVDKFVLVYLDDILIFSKTKDEHEKHLRMVLQRLRENKLYVNPKKCDFNKKAVEFLGYRVSEKGVLPSSSKINAIREWPRPTNVQEVRQFIGLCSHYRRFISGFSTVATPLTDLTKGTGAKKRSIHWTSECELAFKKLKDLMSTAPVLQSPDLTKPFIIETDASDFGVGAVLLQKDNNNLLHPIAYESKKLSASERNYPPQERELIGILHALRTWRCFIDGSDYTVFTDHNPLQYLRSQKKPTPRLVRWLSEIEAYDPKIKYKPGKENGVPDALSRRDGPNCTADIEELEPKYLYQIEHKEESDWPEYYRINIPSEISEAMKKRMEQNKEKFVVRNNKVYRKIKNGKKFVLVQFCPFSRRADLVEKFHAGFGHLGKTTVYDLLKKRWWWPDMSGDIQKWLSYCPQCQLAASPNKNKHHAPMVPLDIPPAFSRWHLDFIGELPTTKKGNRWLLTAVDYTTNWPIARALPEATAEAVADFIYEEIVMKFGCPAEIVTDRGANFLSKLVKSYCERLNTTHRMTSAFHPRSNGKCERLNGILKTMLRKYVHGAIHIWDQFVDTALFAARIRKHRSAGYSPFYLVYGREPVIPGDDLKPYLEGSIANDPRTIAEHTARELESLGQERAAAEQRMRAVSEADKLKWDAVITKVDFEIGDHVLLRNEQKYGLEYNWMGPYIITGKNDTTNIYKLISIGGEPYPSWVHVDRLKEVKAESVAKPWYNPTVSRAVWRSQNVVSTLPEPNPRITPSPPTTVQVDQRRSTVLEGSDVVAKRKRH